MQELFRQNAYGDTWQEPELFDQPGLPAATLPAVETHRGWCHLCRATVETPHHCHS